MSKVKYLILAALAVMALVAVPTVQANLISNGDMELGTNATTLPNDWSTFTPPSGGTVGWINTPSASNGIPFTTTKSMSYQLSSTLWIWQDILVQENTDYTVDFWQYKSPVAFRCLENGGRIENGSYFFFGPYGYYINTTMADYQGDPEANWIHITHGNTGMTPLGFHTAAGTTTVRIEFLPEWPGNWGSVDNVNVIPEPATLAVLGLGVVSFLVTRRRR